MARVTTRTGDEGYTSLLGNARVPKYHRRPEAYGTLDEATAALGMARAHTLDPILKDRIHVFQKDLYTMMAELATPPENYDKVDWKIVRADVDRLDALGDQLKTEVEIGKQFVVPGETVTGACLDLARTIIRRGERQVARLYHEGDITNGDVLRYLNRLSDVIFILARHEESSGRARKR